MIPFGVRRSLIEENQVVEELRLLLIQFQGLRRFQGGLFAQISFSLDHQHDEIGGFESRPFRKATERNRGAGSLGLFKSIFKKRAIVEVIKDVDFKGYFLHLDFLSL